MKGTLQKMNRLFRQDLGSAITTDLYARLQSRFQFLILLTIFVPTIFTSLFDVASEANKEILSWGMIIAILVLDYILLELLRTKLLARVYAWINGFVLLNIAAFVPFLFILGYQNQSKVLNLPSTFVLSGSILILQWTSFLLGLILLIHFFALTLLTKSEPVRKIKKHD